MAFSSNGKILLTSEYLVMDGAKSIAFPSKLSQELNVININSESFFWKAYDHNNNLWFQEKFKIKQNEFLYDGKKNLVSERLKNLFNHLSTKIGHKIFYGKEFNSKLNFNRNWGLGSSSTLVNNLAKWARVDPYELLNSTFKGSGYDIACCDKTNPIIFMKKENKIEIIDISFRVNFLEKIYLIYTNRKQSSESSLNKYYKNKIDRKKSIQTINQINDEILKCCNLNEFEYLINKHEEVISKFSGEKILKKTTFKDYDFGIVKSIGAWGGDFILVTSKDEKNLEYFKRKGLNTIFKMNDLVYTG